MQAILPRTPKETTQIVTGAQIPLSQLRNDAVDNLLSALTIAGHYIIPGTLRRHPFIHQSTFDEPSVSIP